MYLAKSKNLEAKSNFKFKYTDLTCPLPRCKEADTQEHIYNSSCLPSELTQNVTSSYNDLYNENLEKSIKIMKTLKHHHEERQKLLSSLSEDPKDQDLQSQSRIRGLG